MPTHNWGFWANWRRRSRKPRAVEFREVDVASQKTMDCFVARSLRKAVREAQWTTNKRHWWWVTAGVMRDCSKHRSKRSSSNKNLLQIDTSKPCEVAKSHCHIGANGSRHLTRICLQSPPSSWVMFQWHFQWGAKVLIGHQRILALTFICSSFSCRECETTLQCWHHEWGFSCLGILPRIESEIGYWNQKSVYLYWDWLDQMLM
jgi:hypothetical protein